MPEGAAPREPVKRILNGHKTAEKDGVIAALKLRYLNLPPWPEPRSCREHSADAAGAVVAFLITPVVPLARQLASTEDGGATYNARGSLQQLGEADAAMAENTPAVAARVGGGGA